MQENKIMSKKWDIFLQNWSKVNRYRQYSVVCIKRRENIETRWDIGMIKYSKLWTKLCHSIDQNVYTVAISDSMIYGESYEHVGKNISWDVSMKSYKKLADTYLKW